MQLEYAKKQVKSWVAVTTTSPSLEPSSPGVITGANYFEARTGGQALHRPTPSRALSGLGFGRGRKGEDVQQAIEPNEGPGWCEADVSEVSAKDDYGLFRLSRI